MKNNREDSSYATNGSNHTVSGSGEVFSGITATLDVVEYSLKASKKWFTPTRMVSFATGAGIIENMLLSRYGIKPSGTHFFDREFLPGEKEQLQRVGNVHDNVDVINLLRSLTSISEYQAELFVMTGAEFFFEPGVFESSAIDEHFSLFQDHLGFLLADHALVHASFLRNGSSVLAHNERNGFFPIERTSWFLFDRNRIALKNNSLLA